MRKQNLAKAAIIVKAALLSMAMTGCSSDDDDVYVGPVDPSNGPVEPVDPSVDPSDDVNPAEQKEGLEVLTLNGGIEPYWRGVVGDVALPSFIYFRVINHDDDAKDIKIDIQTDFAQGQLWTDDGTTLDVPKCGESLEGHSQCDVTVYLADNKVENGKKMNTTLVVNDLSNTKKYESEVQTTEVSVSNVVNTDNDVLYDRWDNTIPDYFELGKTYPMTYKVEVQGVLQNVGVHVSTETQGEVDETYNFCENFAGGECIMHFNLTPKKSGEVKVTYKQEFEDIYVEPNQKKVNEHTVTRAVLEKPITVDTVFVKAGQLENIKLFDMNDVYGDKEHNMQHSFLISTDASQDPSIIFDKNKETKETWEYGYETEIQFLATRAKLSQYIDGATYSLNTAKPSTNDIDERVVYMSINRDDFNAYRYTQTFNLEIINKNYQGQYDRKIIVPIKFQEN
mgnify:CR=1 FL=1